MALSNAPTTSCFLIGNAYIWMEALWHCFICCTFYPAFLMLDLSADSLKRTLTRLGYTWYDDRPNLIGVRKTPFVADQFSDTFVLVWKQPEAMSDDMTTLQKQVALNQWLYRGENGKALSEDGKPGGNTRFAEDDYKRTVGQYRKASWVITTYPGLFFLQNPANPKGTAIYKPGQYVDAYSLGFHKGKQDHPALLQTGIVTVYRDDNKNKVAEDLDVLDTGKFGCNIHRSNSSGVTNKVGKWSAGCQVFRIKTDHDQLLRIANSYVALGISKFTYTLIKDTDIQ